MEHTEEFIDVESIGSNEAVSKMYSNVSHYPGQYISLLKDTNKLRKSFFTKLARKYQFNARSSQSFVKSRFRQFCPPNFDDKLAIMDVGCGTGEFTLQYALAFPNAQVFGVDNSAGSLKWAQSLSDYFEVKNVKFLKANCETDNLNQLCVGQKFDLINCSGVLHHIRDSYKALNNMKDVMKPKASTLWLFLYGDYGRHLENSMRRGLRLIYPNDNHIRERAQLAKDMRLDRRILGMYGVIGTYGSKSIIRKLAELSWKWRRLKSNFRSFGFEYYADRLKDTDIYDAFAHPIVKYYNSTSIQSLINAAGLELVDFNLHPVNSFYKEKIHSHLESKDIFSKMKILESFYYPESYYISLKRMQD